ncbi:MAG: hypothetical protein ACKVT0_14020 [Planctomycetaceae bacterium]
MRGIYLQFLEKLVTQFTWRQLFIISTFAIIAFVGFTLFELYTGHFRLTRIERKAKLLDTLIQQREQIAKTCDPRISQIHDDLISDLQWAIDDPTGKLSVPTWLLKAAASAAPWLAIAVLFYFVTEKSEVGTVFTGILIITIPVTFIGAIIPDFSSNAFINYWLYPLGAFALIIAPMLLYGQRHKNSG